MITILKKINTVIAVATTVVTSFELMTKTFKWYEKLHGKDKEKKETITRPIVKGV